MGNLLVSLSRNSRNIEFSAGTYTESKARNIVNSVLINQSGLDTSLPVILHSYASSITISRTPTWTHHLQIKLSVYSYLSTVTLSDHNGNVLYDGKLNAFTINHPLPTSLAGKTVRFNYGAGSMRGNRLVKVTDVENKGSYYLIRGTDLVQDQPRCYKTSEILGNIDVVEIA